MEQRRLLALVLVSFAAHAAMLAASVGIRGDVPDFAAFYTGAGMVLADPGADPYLTPAFFEAQQATTANTENIAYWLNPPPALLLYVPFALLPYGVGLTVWMTLGFGCWFAAHRLVQRHILGEPMAHLLAAGLLLLPLTIWTQYAQTTPLVLLVLTGAYVLLLRGREGAAGALLSLLTFKPQLAIGMALALAVKGRWRALAAGTLGGAAQVGLALALWPEQFRHFAGALPRIEAISLEAIAYGNHTLHGAVRLAGLPDGVAHAAAVAVLGALVVGWRRVPWAPESEAWRRAMASTVAVGLLLGVHVWTYDLGLLLLPGFVLAGLGERRAVMLGAVAVVAGPVLSQGFGLPVQITAPALLAAAWMAWPGRAHSSPNERRVGWPADTTRTPGASRLPRGAPALTVMPVPPVGSGIPNWKTSTNRDVMQPRSEAT